MLIAPAGLLQLQILEVLGGLRARGRQRATGRRAMRAQPARLVRSHRSALRTGKATTRLANGGVARPGLALERGGSDSSLVCIAQAIQGLTDPVDHGINLRLSGEYQILADEHTKVHGDLCPPTQGPQR